MACNGITTQNLSMIRGDTLSFNFEITGTTSTLSAAYFTARDGYNGTQIFKKSLGSGITALGDGVYVVRVAPADTASLDNKEQGLEYDLEIHVGNDVYTILYGYLRVYPDVTY